MKIFGVGLPRTGTATLCRALQLLGLNAIHHAPDRLPIYPTPYSAAWWCRYDDVDAITDAPACYWFREVSAAYPDAKLILTVRDESTWWESVKHHVNLARTSPVLPNIWYSDALHAQLFGSAAPSEYLWRRRFREHNAAVVAFAAEANKQLLTIDISAGDKWDKLCPFLGVEPPADVEFPWENRKKPQP